MLSRLFLPVLRDGRTHSVPILLAVLVSGCVSPGGGGASHNVIGEGAIDELTSVTHDAYDVLERLRPEWLRSRRGIASISNPVRTTPVVYVNGVRFGEIDALRRIHSNVLGEIRYLSPTEAGTMLGLGHPGGALLVQLRGS